MARTMGSKNRVKDQVKDQEVLYKHGCPKCGFKAITSIKSAVIGHVCLKDK